MIGLFVVLFSIVAPIMLSDEVLSVIGPNLIGITNQLSQLCAFYEKPGFQSVMGKPAQNWLILRNGTTTIGLFQDMFEENILTFNPGWDDEAKALKKFDDVREIQKRLKASGLKLSSEIDPSSTGPASLTVSDPDGNVILIDQHVQ